MILIRKSEQRGRADHGWLDSHHTFSFGDYYDPHFMGFRSLRVINEDRVAPEMGFGKHPHRNMEIISYIVSGSLLHQDSMGNRALMKAGDVQRISAGSGIEHSEMNSSSTEPVHFLQIWITPDQKNSTPDYGERSFAESERGKLHLIASKSGREGSLTIHQDADLFLGKLERGDRSESTIESGRALWIQVIQGEIEVEGNRLLAGDAVSVEDLPKIEIHAVQQSDFLFFNLR